MSNTKWQPLPIIDNLNYIENPFTQAAIFSAKPFFQGPNSEFFPTADRDLEYTLKFLYSYNGSSATFNAYRRELERLLQWCWNIQQQSVMLLQREHIESFIHFCITPPLHWIGTKNVSRFITIQSQRKPNPAWRPFVVSLPKSLFKLGHQPDIKQYTYSQAAVKATFTALSSFYEFLLQENLVAANPVALIRQKSKFICTEQTNPVVRRISNLQWNYVIDTAEAMAQANPVQHERTLFIINCLFTMYLRISELVADERAIPRMGNFQQDHDGNWWFHVTGKGNKNRVISVCDAMINALKRYRKYIGLTPLPTKDEQLYLITKTLGNGPITSSRHIRRIVQDCFDRAYLNMQTDGLSDDAQDLKVATVHWLRHTGISEDVKIRPREHVRDDAGHASMATTDRYIESDLRERHLSAKKKLVKDL